jgi:cytochrome c1
MGTAASHIGSDGQRQERRRKKEGLRTIQFLFPLLLIAACKSPPDEAQHMPQANAARGLEVIARVGCGACHAVPGLYWPAGESGPSLEGFAEQGLVAGRLPNRPDVLATFVRDAPAALPGTTMPAMPLSPSEARDVAAYLYATGKR